MRSAWALGRSRSHLGPRGRRQIDSMSGGIHGSFTPQDGHTVASRATSVVHSRQGTGSAATSVLCQKVEEGYVLDPRPSAYPGWPLNSGRRGEPALVVG